MKGFTDHFKHFDCKEPEVMTVAHGKTLYSFMNVYPEDFGFYTTKYGRMADILSVTYRTEHGQYRTQSFLDGDVPVENEDARQSMMGWVSAWVEACNES